MTGGTRSCAQRELRGSFRSGIIFIDLRYADVQGFDGHGELQWTALAAECRLTATPLIIIFGHVAAPQPMLSNKGDFQILATCIFSQFSLPESLKTAVRAMPSSLRTPAPAASLPHVTSSAGRRRSRSNGLVSLPGVL